MNMSRRKKLCDIMKLIDKYLLRQFLVPLFYCLLSFSMVFVIIDLFEHLSDFIEAKTSVFQVVRYYVFILPSLCVFIAPISLLLGTLYCLWQLTKHNELTAMRTSGISFLRLATPLLFVGLCFSVMTSILQESVAPWSTYWASQFIVRQKRGNDLTMRYAMDLPFKNERDNRVWVIRKFDLDMYTMKGIKVIQQRPDGSDLETIMAEDGKYYDGCWWFFNITVQKHDIDNKPVGPVRSELIREMTGWTETPRNFINEVKDTLFLSSKELLAFLKTHKNLSAKTHARIAVDMHSRLAMPWTCLIVTLFGVPYGVHTGRKGAFMGVIAALLTFFSFYLLMTFCQWLGKNQVVQPWLSAWMANIIFLLVGLRLMERAR